MALAITGAAGNLGGLLAQHLLDTTTADLRLLIHRKDVASNLRESPRVRVERCDLAVPETLHRAVEGADCIVHFAGVLFKANPERFLPTTNAAYFRNLLDAAVAAKVRRVILISFPHVEGETTRESPATGKLDGRPQSAHARTRLEEEKCLFEEGEKHGFEAISLRVGMVYGRGILMCDAARWFAERRLLGVWRDPTWIHLISTVDFLNATSNAALRPGIKGIYHLGDEGYQTLQEFLDTATEVWGVPHPWRMPLWMIYAAAWWFEFYSSVFATASPLTGDFVTIGRCSYYGDTRRMRDELLEKLTYPDLAAGKGTL